MTNTQSNSKTGSTFNIKSLYKRLNDLGIKKQFLRELILPDWWCDQFEQEEGAVVEAAAYVSRYTSLDFHALLDESKTLSFVEQTYPCYKLRQGTEKSSLAIALAMGERISELVAFGSTSKSFKSLVGLDAQSIRSLIQAESEFVSLESLLNFCWRYGIPVAHANNFPNGNGLKKFDGMVGEYNQCPVILISKNHKSLAWLAFILAHELGHIMCGHVHSFSIVDEKINPEPKEDMQEVEADEFAIELLYGRKNASYFCLNSLDPSALVAHAYLHSKLDRVIPAAVVLNYAWYKEKMAVSKPEKNQIWAIANLALKQIEDQTITAPRLINHYLKKELDWELLSDDNQEFLQRMAEIE